MRNSNTIFAAAAALGLMVSSTALAQQDDQKTQCAADCAKACCVDLASLVPDFELPKLWIGDKAPELKIAEFVKGESVQRFEKDQAYIVEFWATWCGPCIRAFPHMSEIQHTYKDKVRVIGVNVWDTKKEESQGQRIQRVSEFVTKQDKRMSYTVAVEDGELMAKHWMKAAGQRGIPAAFIVDGAGKIAWVGHPMQIEEPLKQVMAGKHDYEKTAAGLKEGLIARAAQSKFNKGIRSEDAKDAEKAYQIGRALIAQKYGESADMLNSLAWPVLDDAKIVHRDLDFAYDASKKACELTEWKNPMIIDTFALACFKKGKVTDAIEYQMMAIKLLEDEELIEEFQDRLDMFKADL